MKQVGGQDEDDFVCKNFVQYHIWNSNVHCAIQVHSMKGKIHFKPLLIRICVRVTFCPIIVTFEFHRTISSKLDCCCLTVLFTKKTEFPTQKKTMAQCKHMLSISFCYMYREAISALSIPNICWLVKLVFLFLSLKRYQLLT